MALKNANTSKKRKLERELNEDLKKHIISEEVIKITPDDFAHKNYMEGVRLGLNDRTVYKIDDVATKTHYTKTKKVITKYDDEGKELIRTYLENINKPNKKDDKKKKKVKGARILSEDSVPLKFSSMTKAFIKHDVTLRELINNQEDGKRKALRAIGTYLRAPLYIPVAVSIYSLVLGLDPRKIINIMKNNEAFMTLLQETGYLDVVMHKLGESTKVDLSETQVIEPVGRGI